MGSIGSVEIGDPFIWTGGAEKKKDAFSGPSRGHIELPKRLPASSRTFVSNAFETKERTLGRQPFHHY
ncbi:hypothetical protein GW7_15162 [Heterocephalus glaber]|uniref:Uncharacterized protein n=1 Tax=Heterocephalus glaber TaxID=10181 RepID=G5AK05_HETGA|nr:hypothetical protein GW7_15162 [Heterocephalus glaber]